MAKLKDALPKLFIAGLGFKEATGIVSATGLGLILPLLGLLTGVILLYDAIVEDLFER
jgi:hypothetical protein